MPGTEKSSDDDKIVPFSKKIEYHATLHDLPTDERPRERLQHHGPRALSNAELLAIILRTGTTRDNVLELAGKLLAKYSGLGGLMRADFIEICNEYGLGSAKTAQLKAALEIGRRLGMLQSDEKYQFRVGYFHRFLLPVRTSWTGFLASLNRYQQVFIVRSKSPVIVGFAVRVDSVGELCEAMRPKSPISHCKSSQRPRHRNDIRDRRSLPEEPLCKGGDKTDFDEQSYHRFSSRKPCIGIA